MKENYLKFTAFTDETGSITDDTPEIFGNSIFLIENSEIKKCRAFLKERYPTGIHCCELENNKLLEISKEIGDFLNNKNCLAVTSLQVNKNLIKNYQSTLSTQIKHDMNKVEGNLLKEVFLLF